VTLHYRKAQIYTRLQTYRTVEWPQKVISAIAKPSLHCLQSNNAYYCFTAQRADGPHSGLGILREALISRISTGIDELQRLRLLLWEFQVNPIRVNHFILHINFWKMGHLYPIHTADADATQLSSFWVASASAVCGAYWALACRLPSADHQHILESRTASYTVVRSGHLFPKPSHNTTVLKCCVVTNLSHTTQQYLKLLCCDLVWKKRWPLYTTVRDADGYPDKSG